MDWFAFNNTQHTTNQQFKITASQCQEKTDGRPNPVLKLRKKKRMFLWNCVNFISLIAFNNFVTKTVKKEYTHAVIHY